MPLDVAVIWFERPDRLNAFRLATFQMLHEAFDQVSADDAVRAVVLIGRGRGFCAGEELEEMEGFSLACRLRNGTFHFLPRIVGLGRAAEWLLTARKIPASEALTAGLVSAVAERGLVVEQAVVAA